MHSAQGSGHNGCRFVVIGLRLRCAQFARCILVHQVLQLPRLELSDLANAVAGMGGRAQ